MNEALKYFDSFAGSTFDLKGEDGPLFVCGRKADKLVTLQVLAAAEGATPRDAGVALIAEVKKTFEAVEAERRRLADGAEAVFAAQT
jgi:hypothetical protein